MQVDIEGVSRNIKLLIGDVPHNVDNVDFVKPGKGRGIYRLRLRNMLTGNVVDVTYRSGEKVEEITVTTHEMQYLYEDRGNYVFMDNDTFEQHTLSGEQIGDRKYYFKEGTPVTIQMFEDKPIDITIPKVVELKVVESTIATKSDTITAQMKTAVLETGLQIGVPSFVKEGDVIKVDTRSGTYIERVGTKY